MKKITTKVLVGMQYVGSDERYGDITYYNNIRVINNIDDIKDIVKEYKGIYDALFIEGYNEDGDKEYRVCVYINKEIYKSVFINENIHIVKPIKKNNKYHYEEIAICSNFEEAMSFILDVEKLYIAINSYEFYMYKKHNLILERIIKNKGG